MLPSYWLKEEILKGFFYSSIIAELRWKFLTANGDIGFQIFCIKDDNEEVMMVPRDRLDSHKLIEDGEIACIYSGICKMND